MIEIKIDNDLADLKKYLVNVDKKLNRNINRALQASAQIVRNYAVVNIQRGPRNGRTYRRRNIVHTASAAGEFPKTDTGALVQSIRTDYGNLSAKVGSDLNYSAWLEKGTLAMKPRPWLAPSLQANMPIIKALLNEAVTRSIE